MQLWSGSWLIAPIQDGAIHEDLVAIAQTGNWGAQPGNAHRQLVNHFCSNVKIAESFDVWVPCTHPKTNKDALEKAFPNLLALEKAEWQTSGKKLPNQAILS